MNAEWVRRFGLGLPHAVESMQWGDNVVLWVGDKALGGKMFVLMNLAADGRGVVSYLAGAERYHELLEVEGVKPAPYFARIYWVAVERWGVFRAAEWESELRAAYEMTYAKLAPKVKRALALPLAEQRRLIAAEMKKQKAAKGEE